MRAFLSFQSFQSGLETHIQSFENPLLHLIVTLVKDTEIKLGCFFFQFFFFFFQQATFVFNKQGDLTAAEGVWYYQDKFN